MGLRDRTEQADFFFRFRSCALSASRKFLRDESVGLRREKSLFASGTAVGINLSPQVVDYFKALADETGLPYQKLIDFCLLECPCSAGLSPELWGSRRCVSGSPASFFPARRNARNSP
jgi:hypothetical protein